MGNIERAMDVVDEKSNQVVQGNLQQKTDLIETRTMLSGKLDDAKKAIDKKISENNLKILYNMERLTEQDHSINTNVNNIKDIREQVKYNTILCNTMRELKVDVHRYEREWERMVIIVKQLKMGLTDNFCQLIATDNYLEKYLPFRIQNLISTSIMSQISSN